MGGRSLEGQGFGHQAFEAGAVLLCHLLTGAAWQAARSAGAHAPPELARDGFLHCCREQQVAFVAGRHFAGRTDLLVLRFDPARVGGELRWVDSEPDQAPFPHLYGPIPLAAVADLRPLDAVLGEG